MDGRKIVHFFLSDATYQYLTSAQTNPAVNSNKSSMPVLKKGLKASSYKKPIFRHRKTYQGYKGVAENNSRAGKRRE